MRDAAVRCECRRKLLDVRTKVGIPSRFRHNTCLATRAADLHGCVRTMAWLKGPKLGRATFTYLQVSAMPLATVVLTRGLKAAIPHETSAYIYVII